MMDQPLTPEEYQKLLDLGNQNMGLDNQIAMQQKQADMLRQGNRPDMRQAGRLTVAPHWMELVGGLAREGVGNRVANQAMQGQNTKVGNMGMQNNLLLKALMGNQRLSQPGTPTVTNYPNLADGAM